MRASVKRIRLLIVLTLVVVPLMVGCAAVTASGPAAASATGSSAGRAGNLSTVSFHVPTVT